MAVRRRWPGPAAALVLCLTAGCSSSPEALPPLPEPGRPTSFSLTDQIHDVESSVPVRPSGTNLDLVGVGGRVGDDGLRLTLRYADLDLAEDGLWGIRFQVLRSTVPDLSVSWKHLPGSSSRLVRLEVFPRVEGCAARLWLAPDRDRADVVLTPGCLPTAADELGQRWVELDSIESTTTWHHRTAPHGPLDQDFEIAYGWDRLFGRGTAEIGMRLYLPPVV